MDALWRSMEVSRKMTVLGLALALAVAAMQVGCGGTGPAGQVGPAGPPGAGAPGNEKIAGEWHYVSGPMMVGANLDRINYLELDIAGSGTLYTSSPANGINGCGSVAFAVLSDSMVAATLPDFSGSTQFYRYTMPSPDALTLTDPFGNVTSFQRAAGIPSSATCSAGEPGISIAVPDNHRPDSASGLATDGTSLWYSPRGGGVLPINPVTGATGTLLNPSFGYPWLKAIQGTDFWLVCTCGDNSSLERRRLNGTLVTSFYLSDPPIHRDVDIEAVTYDGTNLWVAGFQRSVEKNVLLKLNASVTPPTLLAAFQYDAPIRGLAFKSGDLWILTRYVGPVLIKADPATGMAKATYTLPHGFDYQSLTFLNGKFYALRGNNNRFNILPISGL